MPLITADPNEVRLSTSQTQDANESYRVQMNFDETPPTSITWGESLQSAIQADSITAGIYNEFSNPSLDNKFKGFDVEEGYNVFDDLEGYEDYSDSFINIRNSFAAKEIKGKIDQERNARHVLANSGGKGVVSTLAVGLLDPISLGMNVVGGVGFIKSGASVALSAIKTSALVAAQTGVEETFLQAEQITRTAAESTLNIAGSALLGGVIGAGTQKFVNRSYGTEGTQAFNDTADELVDNINSVYPIDNKLNYTPEMTPAQQQRVQGVVNTIDDESVRINVVGQAYKNATDFLTPLSRTSSSESLTARQVSESMAENAYIKNKNEKGIATDFSVETLAKSRSETMMFNTITTLKDNFKKSPITEKTLFDEQVGIALRNGDKSNDPAVTAAAKELRKTLDEMKEDNIKLGIFDEDISPEGAETYFTRIYATEIINERGGEFHNIIKSYIGKAHEESQLAFKGKVAKEYKNLNPERTAVDDIQALINNDKDYIRQASRLEGDVSDADVEVFKRRVLEFIQNSDSTKNYTFRAQIDELGLPPLPKGKELDDILEEALEDLKGSVKTRTEKVSAMYSGQDTLSDADLDLIAQKVVENIQGNGGKFNLGDIPDNIASKSPMLKERTLGFIPDNVLQDFLVNDAGYVMSRHIKQGIPEIELTRKFGSVQMTDQLKAIDDEYLVLLNQNLNDAKRTKELRKRNKSDRDDILVMRDRLLGQDGKGIDPYATTTRITKAALALNYVRLLGGVALSSIPDVMKNVMFNGWSESFKTAGSILTSTGREWKSLAKGELRDMGIGLDYVLATRANAMADVQDLVRTNNKFEKGLENVTNKFGNIALINQWNDTMKLWVGVTTQNKILNNAVKALNGKLKGNGVTEMAALGLDDAALKRIGKQFEAHGERHGKGSFKLSNMKAWDDPDASRWLSAALKKEVDNAIVTPSVGDKPIMATSTNIHKLAFQFKSFMIASNNKTLVGGASRDDMNFLTSMAGMVTLGSITYYVKELVNGAAYDEIDITPKRLILEGIDRSGAVPLWGEMNNTATMMGLDIFNTGNLSRYQQRSALASLAGPTGSLAADAFKVTGGVFKGEFGNTEANAARNLLPLQNIFYLRTLMRSTPAGKVIQETITDEKYDAYEQYDPNK